MREVKRFKATFLAAVMIMCALLLSACGGPREMTYQVKVINAFGEPYTSNVIVKFVGKKTATQAVDSEGVATKVLPTGAYNVELEIADSGELYYYDAAQLSADCTQAQVVLSYAQDKTGKNIYAQGADVFAYNVRVGCTYVELAENQRNYFLFTPDEAGTYRFALVGDGAQIGYYGAPYFVQANNVGNMVDGGFSISVSANMISTGDTGTGVFVVGVDAPEGVKNTIMTIVRTGEPERNIADEPWTQYDATAALTPYTLELSEKQKLVYMDISAQSGKYNIVYNEADGLYHFGKADGPVMLMNFGKNAPYVSLQRVIHGDGGFGGAPIRKYFYDENGTFVKKEDYTDILVKYFENMDKGHSVYPLTADLIYIIQNGCSGWWDSASPDYIFEGCNPEYGWMFALCYVSN